MLIRFLREHPRATWTALIALLFVPPKIILGGSIGDLGSDGGQYLDVARHLADGDGYVTSVSPFHQGLPYFPHPSSLYPAWPMVMAVLLKVLPLRIVAVWVPTLLFFGVLFFADRFGRALSPAPLPRPLGSLDGGHVFVLCFASAVWFFEITSKPYTEGLSFALALIFLLRAERLFSRLAWRDGAELGMWIALLFYCRAQFVVFWLALVATCCIEAVLRARLREGGVAKVVGIGAVATGVVVLAFLPFLKWMGTFLESANFGTYFRYDAARVTGAGLTYLVRPTHKHLYAVVLDRIEGSLRAFDPTWEHSYWHSFGLLTYVLPLFVVAVLAAPRAAIARMEKVRSDPRRLWLIYVLMFALGALASTHAVHKSFSFEWYFASRHSLICVFAFCLAALYALRSPVRAVASVAALLIVLGAAQGYQRAWRLAQHPPGTPPDAQIYEEWLEKVAPPGHSVIIAADPVEMRRSMWQFPADLRRRVGVHIFYKETRTSDLQKLATKRGVQYFLVDASSKRAERMPKRGFKQTGAIGHGKDRVIIFEYAPTDDVAPDDPDE